MAVPKEIASIKRFGVRYGRSLKERMGKIEAEQRKLHRCPYCGKPSVKWQAVGIWLCRKCGSKFTGKAYSPMKKVEVKEKTIEEGSAKAGEK